jgi:hypothetical protein
MSFRAIYREQLNSHINAYNSIIDSHESYNFDADYSSDQYLSDILFLASRVLFWPPAPEASRAGRKFDLCQHLDYIAENVTKTMQPTTILLGEHDEVPKGWVLKREFSSGENDVHLPGGRRNPQRIARDGPFRWIAQEYMKLTRELGEFRAICINMEPMLIDHTYPSGNGWTWGEYSCPYSLEEIQ